MMELKPLLAVFDLTKRKKLRKTNGSKKNLTLIGQLAYTRRINTEQKMQSRCKSFFRGRAEKTEIMPVRRKKWFQQRNPIWTRKISKEHWPRRKKPCR